MRHIIYIIMLLILLSGCKTQKSSVNTEPITNTIVETKTEIIYVPDTIFVEIPEQKAERTTQDSTSFLENTYATSEARINPDGSLFHNLNTKPQEIPVEKPAKVIKVDSLVYVDKKIPVYIEKELTWWQETRLKGFYWLFCILVVIVMIMLRKPIASLIGRVIRGK